jgi:hypothetical protein
MAKRIERRHLLLVSSATAASALGAALLAGCKRSDTCPPEQVAKLTAEDKKLRETLRYTDRSPDPQKLCNACQQYLPNTDADCGGCKLIKGPIHPAGSCTAFMAKG